MDSSSSSSEADSSGMVSSSSSESSDEEEREKQQKELARLKKQQQELRRKVQELTQATLDSTHQKPEAHVSFNKIFDAISKINRNNANYNTNIKDKTTIYVHIKLEIAFIVSFFIFLE